MSFRALALLVCAHSTDGAYQCPMTHSAVTGDPKCAGATYATCTSATCCTAKKYCSGYLLKGAVCGADEFFDLKKTANVVGGTQTDADIKSACCTVTSAAKCSDWLNLCAGGIRKVNGGSINAPALPTGGKSISNFDATCCAAETTCLLDWVGVGLACKADPATMFYDLKKNANQLVVEGGFTPTADQQTSNQANRVAACCTLNTAATCFDWTTAPTYTCDTGSMKVMTNSLSSVTIPTAAVMKQNCCTKKATCSSFTCPSTHTSKVGTTVCSGVSADTCLAATCCTAKALCKTDSGAAGITGIADCSAEEKKFFDWKKGNEVIAATTADVTAVNRKATCCTSFADASCWDWAITGGTPLVGKACAAATFDAGMSVTRSADGDDGKTLTDAAYKESCCVPATTCATAIDDELSAAFKSTVSAFVLLGGLALQF